MSDNRPYLTTDHAASSYGVPVLVNPETRQALGPHDAAPNAPHETAAQWAERELSDDPLLSRFLRSSPRDH